MFLGNEFRLSHPVSWGLPVSLSFASSPEVRVLGMRVLGLCEVPLCTSHWVAYGQEEGRGSCLP